MYRNFNLGIVIISTVTFFLLLFANTCNASAASERSQRLIYETETKPVTEPEALYHSSLNFNKVSNARFYGKRYHTRKFNRSYYRGNQYGRGGKSHYRSNRYYHRGYRNYYPSYRYNSNRYNYRYRYGH
jgi:hypothetical protein